MQSKKLLLPVLLGILGLHQVAQAEEGTSAVTVGALSEVQSQTILYKAQGERAKALREINVQGQSPGQAVTSLYPSIQPQAGIDEPLPVVKLVSGSAKNLRVTLLYSGGFEIDAQTGGPELPGGYRLESISLDNVVVTRAGKRYSLGFSSSPAVSTRPPTSSLPGLPGAQVGSPTPVFTLGQP